MTSSTQPGLIERLGELLAKATPGPWLQGTGGGGGATTFVYEDDGAGRQCRAIVAATLDLVERPFVEREANAALIVEAVNALPDLLATLSSQARLIEAVGKALEVAVDETQEVWRRFKAAREALALITKETTNAR